MKNNQNDKKNIKNHTYDSEADEEVGDLSIDQKIYGDLYLGRDWESLISKHKLRYDIWMFLNLYHELNVSQISKYVSQSKSTVSRVLMGMEDDGLLVSRRGKIKEGGRERIPPKYYSINEKFRKVDETEKVFMEIPSRSQELREFLLSEIRNHRNAIYNIIRLVNYLSSSLNQLDDQLEAKDFEKAKKIYQESLSGLNEPEFNLVFLDKNRFKKFYDLRLEYILKLRKLIMEQKLDAESAFVYFDSFLPLKALLRMYKKENK
ncbi:MAG: winged helix-turn-helix domain-containing protein [Promethearchaeota archaeon]